VATVTTALAVGPALLLLLSCIFTTSLLELVGMLPIFPVLIVFLSFFGIAQHLVGFVNLLKFFAGVRIIRIQVRVHLTGQLAVRLFDLIVRGCFRYAQYAIIIDKVHVQCCGNGL